MVVPAQRRGGVLACFLSLCGYARGANAEEAQAPPSIWYRSSEGCPDGEAFVGRLRGAAAGARLAGAGDRIDFVVTLGARAGTSSGRLERQTERGTVAVRAIESPSCEEVADVLALTLTLALDPPRAQAESSPIETATALPAPAPVQPARTEPLRRVEPPRAASPARDESARDAPSGALSIGAQGGIITSLLPRVAPLGVAFADLEPGLTALPRAAVRVSLLGAFGNRSSEPALDMRILVARLEGCPTAIGSAAVQARPCLGFEGGGVRASRADAETGDDASWAALVGHARLTWVVADNFAVESQVGAVAPLIRYTLRTGAGDQVFRAAPLGLTGSVGAAFRLP